MSGSPGGEDGLALRAIRPGDLALYRDIRFAGETAFTVELTSRGNCRVELYLDGWYHGSLTAGASLSLPPIQGSHTVTLEFYGDFEDASLGSFRFN